MPIHVQERDRACERAVGRLLSEQYEVHQSRGKVSPWDLRILHRSQQPQPKMRPWIYVEVKRRPDIDWGGRFMRGKVRPRIEIDGPLINKSKAAQILKISAEQEAVVHNGTTQGPAWFVCVPGDLVARAVWLTATRLESYAIDRKDTNVVNNPRGDINDRGVEKYVLPWEHFIELGKVDL